VLKKRYILNERYIFYQQTKNEHRSEKLYIFISGGCQVDKIGVDLWEKPLCLIREKVGSKVDSSVKNPISALRCISKSLRHTQVRHTPLRFARRNLGFLRHCQFFSFYQFVKVDLFVSGGGSRLTRVWTVRRPDAKQPPPSNFHVTY
jgi:hypothetical protein